jgi:hypothetical protein
MKIQLWADLPNDTFIEPENVCASGLVTGHVMEGWTRYLIEVNMPTYHFKPQATKKLEGIIKEEE